MYASFTRKPAALSSTLTPSPYVEDARVVEREPRPAEAEPGRAVIRVPRRADRERAGDATRRPSSCPRRNRSTPGTAGRRPCPGRGVGVDALVRAQGRGEARSARRRACDVGDAEHGPTAPLVPGDRDEPGRHDERGEHDLADPAGHVASPSVPGHPSRRNASPTVSTAPGSEPVDPNEHRSMGSGGMYQLLAQCIQQRRAARPIRPPASAPATPSSRLWRSARRASRVASTSTGASTRTIRSARGAGSAAAHGEHPGVVGAQGRRPPLLDRPLVEDVHAGRGARPAHRVADDQQVRGPGDAVTGVGLAAAQREVRRDADAAAAHHAARDHRALPPDARARGPPSARSAPSPRSSGHPAAAATRRARARSSTSLHRAGRRTRRRCPPRLQAGPDRAQDRGEHLVGRLGAVDVDRAEERPVERERPHEPDAVLEVVARRPRGDAATPCRRRRRAGSRGRAGSGARARTAAARTRPTGAATPMPSAQWVSRGPSSSPANCICGHRSQITTMPRVRAFITWRSLRFFSAASVTAHSALAAPIAPGWVRGDLRLLGDRALVPRRSEHEVAHDLHRLAHQRLDEPSPEPRYIGKTSSFGARNARVSPTIVDLPGAVAARRTRSAGRHRYRPDP